VALTVVASSERLDGCARESGPRAAADTSSLNCDSVYFGCPSRGSGKANGCLTQALDEVSAALTRLSCHAEP
jgi:hypothetical protein